MGLKSFIQGIFSVTNKKEYKIISILFFKFKFKRKLKTPTLVLIEPGGIGDYMFCRPFFKYIKLSPKFKNHKIILVTKDIYRDMSMCYDGMYFDKIVGYNTRNYKKIIKELNNYNVCTLINLRCVVFEEKQDWYIRYNIANGIRAKEKIISILNVKNEEFKKLGQFKIYNKIIFSNNALFELERRREFFENILNIPIALESKEISQIYNVNKKHIAVSIMAIDKGRQYSLDKWITILNHIIDNTSSDTEILFLGIESEFKMIQKLIDNLKDNSRCTNIAGKIPISILPLVLEKCSFLLSVETGTVHIAESVGCKTICLCNGSFYGRFQPYINGLVKYVYPREFLSFLEKNKNTSAMLDFYGFNPQFLTETILESDVIKEINLLLNDKENN